jgi:multidrug efflux pump subunit AcrA (membrane-fusion protein)
MRKLITKRNIFVVLLIVGVGLWWWKGQETKKKEKSERKIVSVVRKDLVETLSVSGKVRAEKQAELNFQSGGKLAMVRVKSGEKVERGEWLMGLDTGDLKAIETKAWYSYLAADANAKEVEDDLKGHDKDETFSQKNERVAAQTARDSAYENWLSARRAVDNAVLKSPFSGVVASVSTSTSLAFASAAKYEYQALVSIAFKSPVSKPINHSPRSTFSPDLTLTMANFPPD